MNVSTIKTLLWLVSFGLAGGLFAYAYKFKNTPQRSYWDVTYAERVLKDVEAPKPPRPNILDYNQMVSPVIAKFDWTGAPPKPVVEGPVEDTGPPVAPKLVVSEILAILATRIDTGDPGGSAVTVAWKKPELKDADNVLQIGEKLPKPFEVAVVKDIRPGGVEFAFQGESQENELVAMENEFEGKIVKVGDPSEVRVRERDDLIRPRVEKVDGWPKETVRTAADMYHLGSETLDTIGRDYTRILTEDVKTETHFKDGKRAGLKVTEVRAGSIAAQHGVQSGDVVISINGHPINSQHEGIQYIKNNSSHTTVWQVVLENLGRRRTVTYNSPES